MKLQLWCASIHVLLCCLTFHLTDNFCHGQGQMKNDPVKFYHLTMILWWVHLVRHRSTQSTHDKWHGWVQKRLLLSWEFLWLSDLLIKKYFSSCITFNLAYCRKCFQGFYKDRMKVFVNIVTFFWTPFQITN